MTPFIPPSFPCFSIKLVEHILEPESAQVVAGAVRPGQANVAALEVMFVACDPIVWGYA